MVRGALENCSDVIDNVMTAFWFLSPNSSVHIGN